MFEETGIRSEFEGFLGMSEFQDSKFGMNDLHFLCLLKPVSFEINKCEKEIEDCQWMDVDEYLQPGENDVPFFKKLKQTVSFLAFAKKKS